MNEKVNSQNIIDSLAVKHGLNKKEAETFVKEFFGLIEYGLENENYVKLKGLGTFKLIGVESRESVNVNTGERFRIEGHTKVSFTPDATLRDAVNKPFSHFETVILNDDTVLGDVTSEDVEEEQVDVLEESKQEVPVIDPVEAKPEPVQEQRSLADEIIARELSNARGKRRVGLEEVITQATEKKLENPSLDIPKNKMDKSSVGYLVMMIVIVLLICGGGVGYMYYPDLFSKKDTLQPQPTIVQQTPTPVVPMEHVGNEKADTMAIQSTNEVKLGTTMQTEIVTQPANELVNQDKSGSEIAITGTKTVHKMAPGESLTDLAVRYYQNKDYLIYIIRYNRNVIKNPDNVPVGAELKIPELAVNNK